MAVYGPVRHQNNIIWTLEASVHIIFFDGPVHILPYDPQCHELFAIFLSVTREVRSRSNYLGVWYHDTSMYLVVHKCLKYLFLNYKTGTPVSSTNKTDQQNITEILFKVKHHKSIPPYNVLLYYTLRFYFPYLSLLAQPVNITLHGPGLDCLVFDSVPERYLHYYFR